MYKISKSKKYSDNLKQKVLKEYFEDGTGSKELSCKYGIPSETIRNWIHYHRNPEKFPNLGIGSGALTVGRPKNDEIDWKEKYEILKKFQVFLSARRKKK